MNIPTKKQKGRLPPFSTYFWITVSKPGDPDKTGSSRFKHQDGPEGELAKISKGEEETLPSVSFIPNRMQQGDW